MEVAESEVLLSKKDRAKGQQFCTVTMKGGGMEAVGVKLSENLPPSAGDDQTATL